MINPERAQKTKAIASMIIDPLFRLLRITDVRNVKANCEAPNRAEAVPDSALKGCIANAVDVGKSIPNGSTKKNKGISWI